MEAKTIEQLAERMMDLMNTAVPWRGMGEEERSAAYLAAVAADELELREQQDEAFWVLVQEAGSIDAATAAMEAEAERRARLRVYG